MVNSNRELWLSFIAIILITLVYLFVVATFGGIPAASDLFGHSLGVVGFALMIMTETLYTLRKRSRFARWGRMTAWLQFHIFTGLVGPYLVLLHTSWKFNGLAGIVMLMTVIVVASGFIGRYIYTAVPRTADGIAIEADELQRSIEKLEIELQQWLGRRSLGSHEMALNVASGAPVIQIPSGIQEQFNLRGSRLQKWFDWRRLDLATRSQLEQLDQLLKRRGLLRRQVASLARARRLLALWHAVHIPLGMALFTAALVHIIAAIYFATLLH